MDTALRVFDTLAPFPVFIEIYSGGFDYVERGRIPYIEASGFSESRMKNLLRGRRTVEDQREYLLHPAAPVEKFNVPYLPPEHQQAVWEAMRGVEGVALTSSVAQNIEINAAGTDKGDGLRFLCEYLGVAPDEVMAVGDSRNDLEMLTFAGWPPPPPTPPTTSRRSRTGSAPPTTTTASPGRSNGSCSELRPQKKNARAAGIFARRRRAALLRAGGWEPKKTKRRPAGAGNKIRRGVRPRREEGYGTKNQEIPADHRQHPDHCGGHLFLQIPQ